VTKLYWVTVTTTSFTFDCDKVTQNTNVTPKYSSTQFRTKIYREIICIRVFNFYGFSGVFFKSNTEIWFTRKGKYINIMRSDMQVPKPRNQISTNISISVNPRKMTPTNENDKPMNRYIKYVFFLTASVV